MTTRTLTISSPAEAVAAVPTLLGFYPTTSLVLIAIDRNVVRMTSRADLPTDHHDLKDFAVSMAAFAARADADRVLAFIYAETSPDTSMSLTLYIEWLAGALETVLGPALSDCLHVDTARGRWFSTLCTNPQCCPPQGHPLPATIILGDVEPQVSREAIEASLAHDPNATPDLATLALYRDVQTRDALLVAAARAIVDRKPITELKADLIRHTASAPDEHLAPVASMLALVCYLSGDGATANIAVDRALAVEPDYSLAQLVNGALLAGMPPQALIGALAGITIEQG